MKKWWLAGVLLVLTVVVVSPVYAGWMLYENEEKEVKVGFEDLTGCVLIDFKAWLDKERDKVEDSDVVLAGMKSSFVQWKDWNVIDWGLIGEYDRLNEADFFIGTSYDLNLPKLIEVPGLNVILDYMFFGHSEKILNNVYGDAGLFGSPGWFDNGEERYGGQLGIKKTF